MFYTHKQLIITVISGKVYHGHFYLKVGNIVPEIQMEIIDRKEVVSLLI